MKNTRLVIFLSKHWNLAQNCPNVSISEKIQDSDNFSVPEFDLFMKDVAIFRLKCDEQHSSIPKVKDTSNVL